MKTKKLKKIKFSEAVQLGTNAIKEVGEKLSICTGFNLIEAWEIDDNYILLVDITSKEYVLTSRFNTLYMEYEQLDSELKEFISGRLEKDQKGMDPKEVETKPVRSKIQKAK